MNTNELQTHFIATGKGKNYHKTRQQLGRPLENPFIGYVFSDDSGSHAYMYVYVLYMCLAGIIITINSPGLIMGGGFN